MGSVCVCSSAQLQYSSSRVLHPRRFAPRLRHVGRVDVVSGARVGSVI